MTERVGAGQATIGVIGPYTLLLRFATGASLRPDMADP